MAINRHLNSGESVVFSTRTHPKAIFVPVLIAVVLVVAACVGTYYVDNKYGLWTIWAVAGVGILWFTLWPVLIWLAATYTVTDRRVLTRTGLFTRRGHDIPLNRISDVSYEKDVLDRILGCGTLVISDASTQGRVALPDVPQVERRQLQISDLLFHGGLSDKSDGDH